MLKHFFWIPLFIISSIGWSQINTYTPYSARGIGDVRFQGSAYTNGLGGASVALNDSSIVNPFNPASYASIARQLPLFSFGVHHTEKTLSNSSLSKKERYTGFSHFTLAIPFGKRFGLAGGLRPFSSTGYNIHTSETIESSTIQYEYSGKGGIYEGYIGFSAIIINERRHQLAIGTNGIFYFGQISNIRRAYQELASRESGGLYEQNLRAKAFNFELGLKYDYKINNEQSLTIGGFYRPEIKGRFETSTKKIFYGDYMTQTSYDTIDIQSKLPGYIYLPNQTKIGLTYRYEPQEDSLRNSTKLPSYLVTLEYSNGGWSQYREEFNGVTQNQIFNNASFYRMGFEFTPHRYNSARSTLIKYYDKIRYRIGAYWGKTPYNVNQTTMMDKGITLGLGFPITMNRSTSTINFSAKYGVFGSNNIPNAVQDKYFSFNLGINIAPGYDRWFRKYKYD